MSYLVRHTAGKTWPALFQEEEKRQNIPPTPTTVCIIDSVSLGKVFQHLSYCCCFSSASSLVTLRFSAVAQTDVWAL